MDLSTFGGIQAAVDHYLMDYGLDPADLATLVQTGASRTYRLARVIGMEEYSGELTVEADNVLSLSQLVRYISLKSMRFLVDGKMRPATRRSVEWFFENTPSGTRTQYPITSLDFCRDGNRFLLSVPEDNKVECVYYQRPVPFVGSTDTNWFTENAPDALLWGGLANAEPFVKDDPRIAVWEKKWLEAVSELNAENQEEEGSGSGMVMGLS